MRGKIIQVGKLKVAKSQLDIAIDLYFNSADPVSIHTLGSAAFEIFRKLASNKIEYKAVHDRIIDHAQKIGLKKEVITAFNSAITSLSMPIKMLKK